MRIGLKQKEILDKVWSKKYDYIFLIGPLGANKTFGMAVTDINVAWQFPGSYIPVARKSLAEARKGTVLSYLEALDKMNFVEGLDYKFISGNSIKITFATDPVSVIEFIPLDFTIDRDWHSVKSINATKASVDEVDGVAFEGFIALSARTGRKNTNGAPATTVCTCNPNDKWMKDMVYDPWRKGTLNPKWAVIEFTMQDSFLWASGFYDKYEANPPQWKQRYLYNNWDYQDDENSLFKIKLLDNIHVDSYDDEEPGYLGVDVAREGKDRSVIAEIRGSTLVDLQIYNRDDLSRLARPEEKDALPYGAILGREVIKYAGRRNIGYVNAACDAVGNGGGVVDYCRLEQFKINEFKAGASPIKEMGAKDRRAPDYSSDYDMLRSQMYHQLAMDMEKGLFFFHDSCPHLAELKKELMYHLYEIKDKVMTIESKDKLKLRLGKSPDLADAVTIAYFNKKRMVSKYANAARIAW